MEGSEQAQGSTSVKADVRSLTALPAWKALEAHHRQVGGLHLRQLFADDPSRGERMTAEAAGIYLDYSKNRVTNETLALLLRLADERGLRGRIDAMFGAVPLPVPGEPLS